MSSIHIESFRIRTSEINHNKEIQSFCMIQLMQEASMQHIIKLNVSAWDLEQKKITWVLLKMEVDFYKFPKLGEMIEIQTYPSGLEGYFTYRDYFVYDNEKQLCATSSTMWTLIDTETRKMVRIPVSFQNLVYQKDQNLKRPIFKLEKVDSSVNFKSTEINYFHLDWNGHVNNVQLVKLILETIDSEYLKKHRMKNFQIQFKTEALDGQEVKIYNDWVSESNINHVVVNQTTGAEVLLANSIWEST